MLLVGLGRTPVIHADDRVPTNLSPEQIEVLGRARYLYDQEWHVLTQTQDGVSNTVVLLGQHATLSAPQLEMMKEVVDRFEHVVVPTEISRRNEVGPSGAAETVSRRVRDLLGSSLHVLNLSPLVVVGVQRMWSLAALIEAGAIAVSIYENFEKHRPSAGKIAKAVARWVYTKPRETPLLAIIDDVDLPQVERRLVHRYAFKMGRVACGPTGCTIVKLAN